MLQPFCIAGFVGRDSNRRKHGLVLILIRVILLRKIDSVKRNLLTKVP